MAAAEGVLSGEETCQGLVEDEGGLEMIPPELPQRLDGQEWRVEEEGASQIRLVWPQITIGI